MVIRTPEDALQPFLSDILTGILLWAEDTKNRFKAKVRMIVERLARRFGFDDVAAVMPDQHAKLLTHIRKEKSRQRRQRVHGGVGDAEVRGGGRVCVFLLVCVCVCFIHSNVLLCTTYVLYVLYVLYLGISLHMKYHAAKNNIHQTIWDTPPCDIQMEGDDDDDDGMTLMTGARSGRSSKWAHTAIFGETDVDDRGGTVKGTRHGRAMTATQSKRSARMHAINGMWLLFLNSGGFLENNTHGG